MGKKLTRMEFYKKGHLMEGIKLGFVSLTFLDKVVYYEYYMEKVNSGMSKRDAIYETARNHKTSFATVYRAVRFFVAKN
jgi:hypothetical protein